MAIKKFASPMLGDFWRTNKSDLPNTYKWSILGILEDLDAAAEVKDLEDIGAKEHSSYSEGWYITITVNNVEPCGVITCIFYDGNCYDVNFKEYEP